MIALGNLELVDLPADGEDRLVELCGISAHRRRTLKNEQHTGN
jgi:hypothetical protein